MRPRHLLDRLFGRSRLDRGLDDEIRFHLAERADELVRSGLPSLEAARRARLEFGAVESYKEQCRETRRFHLLHGALEDLRFGFRLLRRAPGFSLLALLCLTLGIGANAAVFSWIEGILLRPFPGVAHQERLMAVTGTRSGAASAPGDAYGVSWPDFRDLERNCTLFDAFIVDRIMGTTLSIGDRAERAPGSVVSSNYFEALGVRPFLGRGFRPEEDVGRNAHPVTVISYKLWQRRYHGDPAVVGRTQLLNGVPHTIVGVAPQGFDGTFVGWAIEFWVPVSMEEVFDPPGYKLEDRGARWIEGFVRLEPGVTPDEAQQEISAVARRLGADYPATNRGRGIRLYPLWQTPFNGAGTLLPVLGVALAVVVFVLLIVCANVSNLLLVRALGRRHEITVRLALGAGRARLLRQLLTEGVILSAFAAAGGLLFAEWCRNLLVLLLPARGGLTMNLPGAIDGRVLGLSLAVGVGSTLLFGLVPAIQASGVDVAGPLKAESGSVVGGRRRGRVRSVLVVVQVALSFVLVVGSVLLLRSMRLLRSADPGFSTRGVMTSSVSLVSAGYASGRALEFEDSLIDRLQATPGVESAAFSRVTPFSYLNYSSAAITVEGYEAAPDELPTVDYNEVGPGYLATLGIPLAAGREFTRADNETAARVAVVNQAMAAQYWRGRDPVGGRFQAKGTWLRVVGVARNSKYRSLTETTAPFFYVPIRQSSAGAAVQIRARLRPDEVARALAAAVHSLDSNLAPGEVITMQEQVDRSIAAERVAVIMLGAFSLIALVLAAVGLYGVMSCSVAQSGRELGLRTALGARSADLLRLVMSHGLWLTAAGVAVGAAAALATSRLLGYLLYGVGPRDPLAFGAALAAMSAASFAACLWPAWRATRTDPVSALRN